MSGSRRSDSGNQSSAANTSAAGAVQIAMSVCIQSLFYFVSHQGHHHPL